MLDYLAIGAHPDDVELTIGGIIAKVTKSGKSVGIVDLTRGEIATRGTPEMRRKEAEASAKVLGVRSRRNLGLKDGQVVPDLESRQKVIEVIREERPKVVLAPHWEDLHPDHAITGRLVMEAFYPTGFINYPAEGEAFRPRAVLFYQAHFRFDPTFVVDTTEVFETKMEAVRCYASQLHDEGSKEPKTGISHPEFLARLEARDRYYGGLIGRKYGEPLLSRRVPRIDSPMDHF